MHKNESLKSNELLFLHQWFKETRLEATLLITLLSFTLFTALGVTLWAHASDYHVGLYVTGYVASALLLCIILVRAVILYRFQWPTEPNLILKTLELAISEKLLNDRPTNESILEYFSDDDTKVILPPHWKKSLPEGFNIQEKSIITIRAINLQQFFPSKRVPKQYKNGHLVLGFKNAPIIAREWQKGLSKWRSTLSRGMIFTQIALAGAATFLPLLQQGSAQNTAIITRLLYVYATLLLVVLMNLIFTVVRNRTISQKLAQHWDENSAADEISAQESLEKLMKQCIYDGTTIAVAESLTGGGLQKRITAISGVSAIFKGGITTYSLESKVAQLSVDLQAAKEMNSVSAEVSQQMAQGAADLFKAQVTLSTTGYAEKPDHPSAELDTPYAYVSLCNNGSLKTERIAIANDKTREEVQDLVCEAAIKLMVHTLTVPEESAQSVKTVAIAANHSEEENRAAQFEIALDAQDLEGDAQDLEGDAQDLEGDAQDLEGDAQDLEDDEQDLEDDEQDLEDDEQDLEDDEQDLEDDEQDLEDDPQDLEDDPQDLEGDAQAPEDDAKPRETKNTLPDLDLELDIEL